MATEPGSVSMLRGILHVQLSGTNAGRRVILESFHGDVWKPKPVDPDCDKGLYLRADASLLVPLDRGTWRVRDEPTGRTTEPVVIGAPAPEGIVQRILEIGP